MSIFNLAPGARIAHLATASAIQASKSDAARALPTPTVPSEANYLKRRNGESRQVRRARVRNYMKGR